MKNKKKKTNDGKLLFILLVALIGFVAFGIYMSNRGNVTELAKVEGEVASAYTSSDRKTTEDGIVYIEEDGYISIVGHSVKGGKIVIPSTIEDKPVKKITDWEAYYNGEVEWLDQYITISDGITEIEKEAFYNNSCIKEINLPNTLKIIGNSAFEYCGGLESLNIPDGIKEIGEGAFEGCDALREVHIGEGVEIIYDGTFRSCNSLQNISLPHSLKKIGDNVFEQCTSLTVLDIPEGVETIGLFPTISEDYNIKKIILPSTLIFCEDLSIECDINPLEPLEVIINSRCSTCLTTKYWRDCYPEKFKYDNVKFYINENYTKSIDLAKSLNVNYELIADKQILQNDILYSKLPSGYRAVRCINDQIEVCNIPEKINDDYVTEIGYMAFSNHNGPYSGSLDCYNLTNINIPKSVVRIGESAFNGCNKLKSIEIPEGVRIIEYCAFCNCDSLESIEIPESVKEIGYYAFRDCDSLKSINILEGLTEIKDYTFESCDNLVSVSLPESIDKIGSNSFKSCQNLTNVKMPSTMSEIGGLSFWGCKKLKSIKIPTGLTIIGGSNFSECSSLVQIVIPETVHTIGIFAFSGCSRLTQIIIPNNVTEIEDYAISTLQDLSLGVTIYAYSEESEAVRYAQENNIPYIIINKGEEPEEPEIPDTNLTEAKVGNKDVLKGFDVSANGVTVNSIKSDGYFANKTVKFVNASGKELADTDKVGTGTKVQITDASGNKQEKIIIIYGDTNGDGQINAIDALAIVKNKAGTVKFTDEVYQEAGRIMSSSGEPSAVDALAIVKYKNGTYTINQNK